MNNLKTELFFSIKNNNYSKCVEILKKLDLKQHEFFDEKVSFITLAVLSGCSNILQLLIQNGSNVDRLSFLNYRWPTEEKVFNSFETSLITATRHGDYKTCEILLKNNAKLNKIDSFSMSALHWAASLNLVKITGLLLSQDGINVNILDLKNHTPVQKAILNNHIDVVKLFTEKVSLEYKFREYLMDAIQISNTAIFKLLLSQIESGKVKLDLNHIDDAVGSILHYAVILSNLNKLNRKQDDRVVNIEIIKRWVEKDGVEINIKNKYGETPLHMTKSRDVARVLLDKGAVMNICEITGKVPFFGFVLRNQFELCYEMLKNGCDIENIDRSGNSLLYAILNSNAPIRFILLLLEAGVALNKNEWKDKQCRMMKKYPKLAQAIEYRLKNPPSLKELARRSLRLHLNKINQSKSIVNSVNKLKKHLPSSLQDYILLL